jgi:hypothetical protein
MATAFNPIDAYKPPTTASKNWWDMPTSNQLGASTQSGFNLPDFGSVVGSQRQASGNMMANQGAQTGQFLQNYGNAINDQEKMRAMYSRLGDELNLPALQNQAQTLTSTLEAIPQTYGSATRGFDVNANQLGRIVGTKQAQLAPLQQKAVGQLQTAQNQIGTQMGLEQAQQQKELQPYDMERQFLTDRMARETSLFTQDAEREYNALVTKMQAGIQLSEAEKNRAQELEMQKRSFENAKSLAMIKEPSAENILKVGKGDSLYDPNTGKWITAPGGTSGTGGGGSGNYYGTQNNGGYYRGSSNQSDLDYIMSQPGGEQFLISKGLIGSRGY